MSFEVENKEELEAWDAYASAALLAVLRTKPITDEAAAKTAALFADRMILERRARQPDSVGFFDPN